VNYIPKHRPKLIKLANEIGLPKVFDPILVHVNPKFRIEGNQTAIVGSMMQGAQRDPVRSCVRAVGLCGWKNVGAIQKSELYTAHGALISVCGKDAIAKVESTKGTPCLRNCPLSRCRNLFLNGAVIDSFGFFGNAG
jgi:hypothetical protein